MLGYKQVANMNISLQLASSLKINFKRKYFQLHHAVIKIWKINTQNRFGRESVDELSNYTKGNQGEAKSMWIKL